MKYKGWYYAENFHQQVNPNVTQRISWLNPSSAVGHTNKYASSQYTVKTVTNKDKKKEKVYNYPWTITAHKFGVDIPDNAHLTGVTFRVVAKISDKADVDFPRALLCIYGNAWRNSIGKTKSKKTGWHNGLYMVNPSKNLSTSEAYYDYKLPSSALNGKVNVADIKKDVMGVDLIFDDETDRNTTVFVKYVALKVEYEVPKFSLTHNFKNNTKSHREVIPSGSINDIKYTLNQSTNANGGTQQLKLDIPWSTEIVGNVSVSKGSYNSSTNTWTINCKGKTKATLSFSFKDYTAREKEIKLGNSRISKSFYYTGATGVVSGYDEMEITYASDNPPHKRHPCCFHVDSLNESDNNTVSFTFKTDKDVDLVSIDLSESGTDSGVSVNYVNYNNTTDNGDGTRYLPANNSLTVELSVPSHEQFNAGFDICIRPHSTGSNKITVTQNDSGKSETYTYSVGDPYSYHIGSKDNDDEENEICNQKFLNEVVGFSNHRIASEVDTNAFVLPCGVKDGDSCMIEDESKLHLNYWEHIDYIGCVPVEHHHFDPKSTYKDSLIDSHYKNNRFVGKQLASDESIDLNIRLHPRQVTTIQGLIDMDKPIPIDANHLCFEGDSLNHRGWAEIYSIQAEKTNEHWYKCKIDVKYLTHNLNTRFHITRGDRTFLASEYPIPSMYSEVMSSGEPIGTNQAEDFFIVNTDGTYEYIDDEYEYEPFLDDDGNTITWINNETNYTFKNVDGESVTMDGTALLSYIEEIGYVVESPVANTTLKVLEEYENPSQLKNVFTLDEGQHISIKSREALSNANEIAFSWMSTRLLEIKENNISRIFRLIDATTKEVVFEYEYCDFDFSNYEDYPSAVDDSMLGILSCRAIGRVKNQEDYEVVFDEEMNLAVDVETSSEQYVDEELGEVLDSLQLFGSTLHFTLRDTTLSVVDEGYNGKEVYHDNIDLEGNQYYYESYWINKNTDGEDNDITAYIDIVVNDTILETDYSHKYDSMYISPFPVSDKKVLFTRQAEEGVLYYLDDNQEEFTYLIDPYYQYLNGVDLRTSDDGTGDRTSIFNLNYGYKVIYLENGLVSLGINRLNGKMYLRRYDPTLKQYVTLFNLELTKYDDININSISDDRIELQASDTTIIMYRGHPYVIFKHELEDIKLKSKFYNVWGNSMDGNNNPYPVMFELMNKENLLPVCATSKMDDDCFTLTEEEVTGLTTVTLSLTVTETDINEGDTIHLTCTGNPSSSKVSLLAKKINDDGFDVISTSDTGAFTYKCEESGAYEFMAVYTGDATHYYATSDVVSVGVTAVIPDDGQGQGSGGSGGGSSTEPSGNYKLSIKSPSTFTYRDNQKVTFTLTKGGVPIAGKVIEQVAFNHIYTATTNEKGQASFENDRVGTHPNKYKIGARFYVGSKLITSVFKDVKVNKATPKITLNHRAETRGNYFSVHLGHKSYKLAKKKMSITINGKKTDYKTNSNGNVNVKMANRGTYKYKVVFNGDKDYKKATFTYREGVS